MLFAKIAVVDDVRTAERRELAEETTLRLAEQPFSVGVFNLSATGCLVRAEHSLRPGTEVRIGLPGVGAFRAEVVRTDGEDAGCRFHTPLTAAELEAAFQRDVVVDGHWHPEPSQPPFNTDQELPAWAKLASIVMLSCGLWGALALSLAQFI